MRCRWCRVRGCVTKVLLCDTNDVGRDDVMEGFDVIVVEEILTVVVDVLHGEF